MEITQYVCVRACVSVCAFVHACVQMTRVDGCDMSARVYLKVCRSASKVVFHCGVDFWLYA